MSKKCTVCGVEIPEGRLKAIPNAATCVNHSTADRYIGNVVSYGDPEAGDAFQDVDIVRTPEAQKQLKQYKSSMGSYR